MNNTAVDDDNMPFAVIAMLAVACGLAVANLYYSQPMLSLFATEFGRPNAEVGLLTTITQLGYAAGLFLFVPLGDRVIRRRLLLGLLSVNTLSLICSAVAPNFDLLLAASVVLGLTSISAQVIIPAVSLLVEPKRRGKVVGILMSGLSSGILLARTLSGLVSAHAGWRAMYWLAAGLDIALILLIRFRLPAIPSSSQLSYGKLLGSLASLLRNEPVLRISSATGALGFAAFSAFWGALAFLLARPPYNFGSDIVGLFGLAALVGIALSAAIGGLIDRVGSRRVCLLGGVVFVVGYAGLWAAEGRIWLLVVAAIFLDIGNRANLIANQTRIYALLPEARSRLNTVFMVFYFIGGAFGTALGAAAADYGGWRALSLVGILLVVVLIVIQCGEILVVKKAT